LEEERHARSISKDINTTTVRESSTITTSSSNVQGEKVGCSDKEEMQNVSEAVAKSRSSTAAPVVTPFPAKLKALPDPSKRSRSERSRTPNLPLSDSGEESDMSVDHKQQRKKWSLDEEQA
jgi:hypothetical protein